jgi:hypothetical protein
VDIPPEQVRDAVVEAGRAVPNLAEPDGVKCFVTGIGEGTIKYTVVLSVANPGILAGPRDEFLSRFWYLAQRRGLHLNPWPAPDAAARLRMLEEGGVFHRDADALPQLAQASAFRRYRRGDLLLAAGAPATDAFLVVAGQLAVTVPTGEGEIRLELVPPGELASGAAGDAGRRLQPRAGVGGPGYRCAGNPGSGLGRHNGPQPGGRARHQCRYRSAASGYPAAEPRAARRGNGKLPLKVGDVIQVGDAGRSGSADRNPRQCSARSGRF